MFKYWSLSSFVFLLLLPLFSGLVHAVAVVYNSTAGLSTKWIAPAPNSPLSSVPLEWRYILRNGPNGSDMVFACGFYYTSDQKGCYFGIFIARNQRAKFDLVADPVVVWSANRNNPVSANATLELTAKGDLVLKDVNGSVAWSTATVGMSVAGMNLTEFGNLVLFNKSNATVWQSFDDPIDSLVLGQKLKVGQKLTSGTSTENETGHVLLSLSLTTIGLFAQTETDPPQVYYSVHIDFPNTGGDSNYIKFIEGRLALFMNFTINGYVLSTFDSSVPYVKFGFDGHLRSYQWAEKDWSKGHDLLKPNSWACSYPTVCGQYGICNTDGQCGCPRSSYRTSYFEPIDYGNLKHGCAEIVPLSCEASRFQTFLELHGTSYLTYSYMAPDLRNTDNESCKKACANNCSCRAAFFYNDSTCYLVSQVFSLTYLYPSHSIAFIKVQNVRKRSNPLKVILISSLGSLFALIILYVVVKFLVLRRKEVDEVEEDCLEKLPGLSTRFTYDGLLAITEGFRKKLGEGGFGSVFEGTLIDGTKVAVKRLNGLHHIDKSFLAEVETIGKIHHINLVRLIGICAAKFHRLLVYEYMSNGALDDWIYHNIKGSFVLDWKKRRKIIYDIAKGINYLHEECKWKIIHMDIKPQNILLDENFNVKVADFGLSKLLDRDQSRAVTTMRGTPGYLAPEWLSATVTHKVDVYSFGVVVLEIICGRKVFDSSQDEEDMYLLGVFKRKAEEGQLLDMVDNALEDKQLNQPHVLNIMRIAAWCPQGDFSKRPSILMVIKVLDGVMEIPDDLDYDFSHRAFMNITTGKVNVDVGAIVSVLPSILSGPR